MEEMKRRLHRTQTLVEKLDGELRLLAEGIVMNQEEIARLRDEYRRDVAALWSLVRSLGGS